MPFEIKDPGWVKKWWIWACRNRKWAILSIFIMFLLILFIAILTGIGTKIGERAVTPVATESTKKNLSPDTDLSKTDQLQDKNINNHKKDVPKTVPSLEKEKEAGNIDKPASNSNINQRTEGHQSPIQNIGPGGTGSITYGEPKGKNPKENK